MKRTINLLAETLALPFSELLNQRDFLTECAEKVNICSLGVDEGKRVSELDKAISGITSDIAGYLNQFLEIPNLTILESMIHYVFKGKDIVKCAERNKGLNSPRAVMNQYYIEQLMSLTELLITTRNGNAVLRPWDSSPKDDLLCLFGGKRNISLNEGSSFSPMKIELWNSLLRCLSEDLILSSYAAICTKDMEGVFTARKNAFRMLLSFGEHIDMADALLDNKLEKGMAETHLHAFASRDFGMIWEGMIRDAVSDQSVLEKEEHIIAYKAAIREEDIHSTVLGAAIIRTVLASYFQSGKCSFEEYLQEEILMPRYLSFFRMFAGELAEKGTSSIEISGLYQYGEPVVPGIGIKDSFDLWKLMSTIPQYLKKTCPSLAERCFLAWSLSYILKKPEDQMFTALFLFYLRKKQKAYRMRVQDSKSKGLQYFQQYYSSSSDGGSTEWTENIRNLLFTAMDDPRVVKTEFRFTPPTSIKQVMSEAVSEVEELLKEYLLAFIREHLLAIVLKKSYMFLTSNPEEEDIVKNFNEKWLNAISNILSGEKGELLRLLQYYEIETDTISPHRMGIIYHLIKKGEKNENDSCFSCTKATERDKYKQFTFGKARFEYEVAVTAISNLRNSSPEISRLIVGIDAAAPEIPTDPWVFAPAFQSARRQTSYWGIHEKDGNRKPLLGITYHVGEDFRHPISGLRHIHEAFCGLDMHPGDRIGHGFALGMDINRWFGLNGMVIMPRIERMENNLWLWHLITTESKLSCVAQYSNLLEKQILEDARRIYRDLHGITVDNLYYSYSQKTKPVSDLLEIVEQNRSDFLPDCRTCFQELEAAEFFPCWNTEKGKKGEWRENILLLSYHCELFKQRMNESIMVFTDSVQREIAEAVQEYMLEKMATNGIIVETNPSSNAVISEMDGVLTHPIWRLRQDKEHRVMATINTDDPSVFNATVANEHAQVYYALLYRGLSPEEALKEVDTMRDTALRTSFISSPVSLNDMLRDYEMILKHIIKY